MSLNAFITNSDNLEEQLSAEEFIKSLRKVESVEYNQKSSNSGGSSASGSSDKMQNAKGEDDKKRLMDKKLSTSDLLCKMRGRFQHRATEPVFHTLATGTPEVVIHLLTLKFGPALDRRPSREELKMAERIASILKDFEELHLEIDEEERLEVMEEEEDDWNPEEEHDDVDGQVVEDGTITFSGGAQVSEERVGVEQQPSSGRGSEDSIRMPQIETMYLEDRTDSVPANIQRLHSKFLTKSNSHSNLYKL